MSENAPASETTRRGFFSVIGAAWTTFCAANAVALAALGRFMIPNVVNEPPSSFKAGSIDEFVIGRVDERFKESRGVWLIRTDEGMYALSTVCTHLGCTPNWLPNERKFKCPCHGSGFYASGINFEGPAPRPLERFRIVFTDDGEILIDKSKKYQQEKGEWSDPEAFLQA